MQVDVFVLQFLWVLGVDIEVGYCLGCGDFVDWDGDLQMNCDGEFCVGVKVLLLWDCRIDK